MAEHLELKDESTSNPCCSQWKDKLLKLQQRFKKTDDARAALKKAIGLYEQQFDVMQNTNLKLKKAYEEEKLQTEHERKDKEKESAARVSLENEISVLKSELLSLSQEEGSVPDHVDGELKFLRGRVFDSEKEIKCLQERLQKETNVAAADRMKTIEEKKRADAAWESSEADKSRLVEEISNLKAQLLTLETEKKQLSKDLQKERTRADSERKRVDEALKAVKTGQAGVEVLKCEKKNMETVKNSLVDDFSSLKSKDILLQHKGHSGDLDLVTSLRGRVSELETEISRLKELLDKERKRVNSETKKAETEKKKADKVREMLKAEQNTADVQRRLVDVERKKAEEIAHQLEKLKCEADEARSKLVLESSNFKNANKKLEAERKKTIKEKRKAEEQQKIVELSMKNALEEKQRADHLHQQLEEYQQKYDKLKKELEETESSKLKVGSQGEENIRKTYTTRPVKNHGQVKQKMIRARNCADLEMEKEAEQEKAAEMYKLHAMTEKSRADKLGQHLEETQQRETQQRAKNASKEIQHLVSSKKLTDPSFVLIQKDMKAKSAEMKLLKKRLKLEKERVKHVNQVIELEKNRKKVVEEELHRLKLEFAQFSNTVGLCSCYAFCNVGKSCLEKNGNVNSKRKFMQSEEYPLHLQSGKELGQPARAATKSSEYFRPNLNRPAPSLPISGTCTESTSGTTSIMEPLLGGIKRKKLDSSALVPSMASFSDRQLVSSQGKYDISNTKPAEKAKENSNLLLSSDAVVADNNVRSPLKVKNKDGNIRKRKRLLNAIESIEHLYTEGKTWQAKIAKNVSALHDILGHMDKPLKEGINLEEAPVRPCKSIEGKEVLGVKTVGNGNVDLNANDDFEVLNIIQHGDYMKLLDLDSAVEEERYRAAVAMPLSPTLPVIELKSNQSNDQDDTRLSEVKCSSSQAQDSVMATRISDSGHKATESSYGNESGSAFNGSLYFVVFPEARDSNSLLKIFNTMRSFTSQSCAFSQGDYVVKHVFSALSADETLSPKEKVCVFFSLFLKSFSDIALTNFNDVFDGNFFNSLDTISRQLRKVMSDVETRTMFAEVCDFDELITLVHRFIIDGRVLVLANISSETPSPSESKASFHQLVLGAILLATVCAAFDRIDSICEASYSISRITSSSTLTFLHVFAYICGEKLSAHGDYSLIMTVINSLVTYCEKEALLSGFPSCTKCPFSDGAVSMEDLASILLQKLWNCASCVQCKSTTIPDGTLSNMCDVLSLLELLASKMSWSWVCENIISQLLKLSEVCVMETPLTAVFVLLGQMARFGIDANGFQDAGVENIRVSLSSFISRSTLSEVALSVQLAVVNALSGTMPLSFQEICKNSKDLPSLVSSSNPTDCIQKWFSLLNDEQKSLSVRLLTAGGF